MPLNKFSFYLRAIFPSWEFFVEPGPENILELNVNGFWQPAIPVIRRSFWSLLVNADAGFAHAAHNSVDHLLMESADGIESSEAYAIVHAFIHDRLETMGHLGAYRFRVVSDGEPVLVSPEHTR